MQGFNMGRYYPPSTTDAPTFNKSSTGSTARKPGPPTIRFELPFAIWCTTCTPPAIIGQGVRFNATKRRIGSYHSTPIWEFGLKHTACGGAITVQTDPRRGEYVVAVGAKRRDYGEEVVSEEERKKKGDAMAVLEGRKGGEEREAVERDRVEELRRGRERDWADPYAANRRLRAPFREGRRERRREEGVREELREKFGLGLEIVEEREEDRRRAGLVEFGVGEEEAEVLKVAAARPLFGDDGVVEGAADTRVAKGKTKAARAAETSRALLQRKLKGNTRAVMDPFSAEKTLNGPRIIAGIKRKQTATDDGSNGEKSGDAALEDSTRQKKALALVNYDSDDD